MIIAQWPNLPLSVAIVGFLLSKYPDVTIHKIGSTTYIIAIIIWAYLEITSGVNLFRKILGVVVLLFTAFSLFKQLL
jgi:hypothetical protein